MLCPFCLVQALLCGHTRGCCRQAAAWGCSGAPSALGALFLTAALPRVAASHPKSDLGSVGRWCLRQVLNGLCWFVLHPVLQVLSVARGEEGWDV